MKKVRCPKCNSYTVFDETRYQPGQRLVFVCSECKKQFAIQIPSPPSKESTQDNLPSEEEGMIGSIIVVENAFHYRQEIPLEMGDNVFGRYVHGTNINKPIETVDPSVDLNHCTINVSRDKRGKLRYTLMDNNSNTGTFVGDVELQPRERRIIENGTLFTLGATSIILRTAEES